MLHASINIMFVLLFVLCSLLIMQVGPSILVLGDIPREYGLSKSFFTRMLQLYNQNEGQRNNIALLHINYRCHKSILDLVQHFFYNWLPLAAKADITPFSSYPLFFVCSSLSKDFSKREEADEREAELMATQLHEFLDRWPSEWGEPELEDVCLMATNRRQVVICGLTILCKLYKIISFTDWFHSQTPISNGPQRNMSNNYNL